MNKLYFFQKRVNLNFRKFSFASLISMLMLAAIVSCDDDDDGITMQDHDDSEMMSLMHANDRSMDSLTMTNDPDNDFAMMMRVHHKGAIDMAKLELQKGNDTTLRRMATKMINEQQAEIAELTEFLSEHAPAVNEPTFHMKAEMTMELMGNNADLQFLNGNTDHDFAILMIQHHHGAIDMAHLELQYGHSEELKDMAEMMIEKQQDEIKKLQDWLLKNY